MAIGSTGNTLVMQSGGPTPVLNRSLFGVVKEAFGEKAFGEIYGVDHGLEGLLCKELIDLRAQRSRVWEHISKTPGAALGSSRRKLKLQDRSAILDILHRNKIRYWFILGGNDSADTGQSIHNYARNVGYELTVTNIPKTIDNDLMETDHSPGYGSAARFVALAAMGAGKDAEAMGKESPVTIVEVMGRDSGWLAASSALAKREERDAPHVIIVPEVPVDEMRFLDRMEDAYRRFGFAVAVVAENARGPSGTLGSQEEPLFIDDFGHPYFEGAGRYLSGLIGRHLKVRARYEKPGTIQRSMMACISSVDAREAEMVGRSAARYALEGYNGKMVTLLRGTDSVYTCSVGLTDLRLVANQIKCMPKEYLDSSNDFVTPEFINYVRPLIGGPLPRFGRLR